MPIFLMTDIEKSTELWEKYHDAMSQALIKHDAIINKTIDEFGGRIIKHTGAGVFAVFNGTTTLSCALALQLRLAMIDWGELDAIRIRIGMHAGSAEVRGDDYFGPVVNMTARLMDAAWGGQIVLSADVKSISALPPGAILRDLGAHQFSGFEANVCVFELIHPDLPVKEFPPINSVSIHIHNLPGQTTAFVGRHMEVSSIINLMKMKERRLLTIIGPGGAGKTRLALHVAAELVPLFNHGVYFVPLTPVISGSTQILVFTIGDSLKFTFYGQSEPRLQLLDYLGEKEIMLVLDNFEHMIEVAPLVGEIIEKCPRVKIIVTSRERLQLKGEHLFELKGLDVPGAEEPYPEKCSAIQLFVQSAKRSEPKFVLNNSSLPAVVEVCRLVEGLPLAIELAASWVKTLDCGRILEEIRKSIDFLATSRKDIPARHLSLRAVFDGSWTLLATLEQRLFMRLSIFQNPFTRVMAEKICAASLPALSSFVDKSLLRRTAAGRYEVLFLVKKYAEEKLNAVPREKEETQKRLCAYYADLLSEELTIPQMIAPGGLFDTMADEIDNIRYVWLWAVENDHLDTIDRMRGNLFSFYKRRDWCQEGLNNFKRAYDRISAQNDAPMSWRIASHLGAFYAALGNYPQARSLVSVSLAQARKLEVKKEILFCLKELIFISFQEGKHIEAKRFCDEAFGIAIVIKDREGIAFIKNTLGNIEFFGDNFEKAGRLFEESMHISVSLNDKYSTATALNNLGNVYYQVKDYDRARDYYERSLGIRKEIKEPGGISTTLNNLGNIESMQGHFDEAVRFYTESLFIKRDIGDLGSAGYILGNLGAVLLQAGDIILAKKYFREALAVLIPRQNIYWTLTVVGDIIGVQEALNDLEKALAIALFIRHHPQATPMMREQAEQKIVQLRPRMDPGKIEELHHAIADQDPKKFLEFIQDSLV